MGGGGFLLWGPHSPEVGYLNSVCFRPMSPRAPPVRRGIGPCLLAFLTWHVGLLCSLFFRLHRPPPVSPPGASVRPLPPPMSPCRLLAVLAPFLGEWGRRGWGGGRPRCPSSGVSTSQARRRHEARHLSLCRRGGGLPCGSRRRLSQPAFAHRRPPRWGLHGACFLRARSCGPSRTLSPLPPHLAALSSGRGGAVRPSLPSSPNLQGVEVCVGGGGLSSFLRCMHVAGTTQARRRHEARHLSLCRGGGMPCGSCRRPSYPAFAPPVVPPLGLARRVLSSATVVWSVPHPLAAASPPCRFVLGGGGGRFSPPPTCIPHPWGGGGVWGGGGALVVFPS